MQRLPNRLRARRITKRRWRRFGRGWRSGSDLRRPISRLREQARSHTGSSVETTFVNTPTPLWERACSRRGPHKR
ncbi:hypothetical protein FGA82_05450 [Pseudomonas fluorescens]|nr:hypothetical protein FGA82_05450 [Pseudomonas fluorescens]